jgi:hypothetical protein
MSKRQPYIPIPAADLPRMVGKQIHLKWAKPGCTWRLEKVEGETLYLRTPKTGKAFLGRASDACYTRTHEPKS